MPELIAGVALLTLGAAGICALFMLSERRMPAWLWALTIPSVVLMVAGVRLAYVASLASGLYDIPGGY
jgi:hypothetical protein